MNNARAYQKTERPATSNPKPKSKSKSYPWEKVSDDRVREIIAGTALAPIIAAFESVTLPPLPLSCTLIKALPVVGCALCQRQVESEGQRPSHRHGDQLARLRIETGGGQVANFWGLVVSVPSSGKDIGNVDVRLTANRDWLLASSGSAEGLADQYTKICNGLLRIGELGPFLNPHHWQSKAALFLLDAYNRGWFNTALSARGNAAPRETDFCYPNLVASVQPAIASRYGNSLTENGFANRFLIGNMQMINWEPNCSAITREVDAASAALDCYVRKTGTVRVPQGYLKDFQTQLYELKAPYEGYWRRLKNEYGPRLAVVLSVRNGDDSPMVELRPDIWPNVEIVLWWLYGQAHDFLQSLLLDEKEARLESLLDRIRSCIRQHGPIMTSQISHRVGRGTEAKDRKAALDELVERGEIQIVEGGYQTCNN